MKKKIKIILTVILGGAFLLTTRTGSGLFSKTDPIKVPEAQNKSKDPAASKPTLSPLKNEGGKAKPDDIKMSTPQQKSSSKDPIAKPVKTAPAVAPTPKKEAESTTPKVLLLDPIEKAIEWSLADWQKNYPKLQSLRTKKNAQSLTYSRTKRYSVSRMQGEGNKKTGIQNKVERDRFITEAPRDLLGKQGSGKQAEPARISSTSTAHPGSGHLSAEPVNYGDTSGMDIKLDSNDILISDAIVEIPKGEGYEALISAGGQGLLTELGIPVLDKAGKPVLDEKGFAKRTPLRRGTMVTRGQVLGKQNDREQAANRLVAQQQLIVANKEAEKQLEVDVAKLAVQVAQSEYLRVEQANRQMPGAVPAEEVVQRAYEWKRADKAAEKAVYDLTVKSDEVEVRKAQVVVADAQVEDRKLISPLDGFIDDVMQNEGQWLREGDPILRIIRLDKVQICGKIDAHTHSPEMVDGKEVTVYVQKPGAPARKVDGRISYARQIVESGKFYIYAEVNNSRSDNGFWLLNPGTIVTMVIHR